MGDLFYWLFNMSIVGAVTGLAVVLIRLIKQNSRRWIVILWGIPFLRFLIPLGVGGKNSLMSLLSRFATKTVVVYEGDLTEYTAMIPCFSGGIYRKISLWSQKTDYKSKVFLDNSEIIVCNKNRPEVDFLGAVL